MFGHKITNFLENRGIFDGNYQNLIKNTSLKQRSITLILII